MPRTIVDIPDSQLKGLDDLCATLNISRAEAVRRAVDQFVKQQSRGAIEGFGLWSGRLSKSVKAKIAGQRKC